MLSDEAAMRRAVELADAVRAVASPNPWVGCVVVTPEGHVFEGATQPPGGAHAEVVALRAAGEAARGATLYCTLEPCAHHGRTPPCADAVVAAGPARVVVALEDPDANVRGRGVARLRDAGISVDVGLGAAEVRRQLRPYLKHRTTGRPWVVLKLAATLDGRTAAPDGSSRWITGPEARADAHRLRAESDAVVVGAGTVRTDDPELTVRLDGRDRDGRQPLRVVLGRAPEGARVHPAVELEGDLGAVLEELGRKGVVQALVEGGPSVAGAFHRAGLVDRYVLYLAPALLGGADGRPVLAGEGATTITEAWRGRIVGVERLGDDLAVELAPAAPTDVFTGIVEELGHLAGREGKRFTFAAELVVADATVGGSIAVDGCCLTVVDCGEGWWAADVVDETLSRTTLGRLDVGDAVNLERPVRLADRLGGHLVQGHVDGVGEIARAGPDLLVWAPPSVLRYVVEKGSVAVDGCSLTVAGVEDGAFAVAIVPHTAEVTTLGRKRSGDHVNLEADLVAKYVERLLQGT